MKRAGLVGCILAILLSAAQPSAAAPDGPEMVFRELSRAFADEDRALIGSLLSPSFYITIRPDSRTVRRAGCLNYLWLKWLPPGQHHTLTVNGHSPCLENGRGCEMNRVSVTIYCDTDGTTRELYGSVSIVPNSQADWPPFVLSSWVVDRLVKTSTMEGNE